MTKFQATPIRTPDLDAILQAILDSQKSQPQDPSPSLSVMRATVSSAYPDPVQVIPDGPNSDPLPGVPEMYCKVGLGDRVLVLLSGKRMLVLGVAKPDQSGRQTMASGSVVVTPTAANTPTTFHVTFDQPFDQVPAVSVTPYTGHPDLVAASYQNPAVDGFDIVLVRPDTTGTTISWIALT